MQGERIPIPLNRNEIDHEANGVRRGIHPTLSSQPRPAALGHSPWACCGIVCRLPPES